MTIGTAVLGVVATGAFGGVAALTNRGADSIAVVETDSTIATSTAAASSAAATSATATSGTSVASTTGGSSSSTTVSGSTAGAHVSTGGS